jgi:hypothetical protein
VQIGVDNYFTLFRSSDNGGGSFPIDTGLTMGVLPFEKLQMELGVDLVEPNTVGPSGQDYPLSFNGKIGSPEDALFNYSPALYIGIFNIGTKKDVTNQNIVYLTVGKTIPYIGRLSVAPYIGNKDVLVDENGNKANTGIMIAFDHGFLTANDKDGNAYNKIVLAADYASGKNAIGGGGVGVYYFFTKDISILTGPVWFNDESVNGKWKWTIQFDVNLPPIFKK